MSTAETKVASQPTSMSVRSAAPAAAPGAAAAVARSVSQPTGSAVTV